VVVFVVFWFFWVCVGFVLVWGGLGCSGVWVGKLWGAGREGGVWFFCAEGSYFFVGFVVCVVWVVRFGGVGVGVGGRGGGGGGRGGWGGGGGGGVGWGGGRLPRIHCQAARFRSRARESLEISICIAFYNRRNDRRQNVLPICIRDQLRAVAEVNRSALLHIVDVRGVARKTAGGNPKTRDARINAVEWNFFCNNVSRVSSLAGRGAVPLPQVVNLLFNVSR